MSKVLITGGAGFIGNHLTEKLLNKGEEVFVIDNLSTGTIENIARFKKNKNFHFVKDTILNKKKLESLVKKCDKIFHLAAAVGVKTIMDKPLESFMNNMKGTENILELAHKYKTPVLFTSTSEVYGKNDKLPFKEEDDRVYGSVYSDRWGYALSKGSDEFVALAYFKEKKLPITIVRLFNVIGPRQTGVYGMVVPKFIKQALSGKDIPVHGNGKQTRCFGDVDDITDALIKLIDSKKSRGKIFNLGSDKEISINDLAKKIKEIIGSKSKTVFVSYAKVYGDNFEDMKRRKPSLSQIKKEIGYKPKVKLEESLKRIIQHETQK